MIENDYDVTELLDHVVIDIPAASFAQAKAWAELAYRTGQLSRDQEISKLRRELVSAYARRDLLAEANERMMDELRELHKRITKD